MSRLDWFWRRLIVTKLYTQGWGKPEDMKRIFHLRKKLGNRSVCQHLVSPDYPVYIDKETIEGDIRLVEGHFMSPLKELLPGIMPKETEVARFQMVLPKQWKTSLRPMCVQMGGTGDQWLWKKKKYIAKPLLQEEGIASLILENPFYGSRKPKNQFRSSLHRVSDLFVMGGCLILESLVLFNWLDRQGYGPLGASGISMGGHTASLGSTVWHKPLSLIPCMSPSTAAGVFTHMASLGATNWHKPLSLIPCMSGSTAAGVFTHGVLSTAIPWKLLMEQYMRDATYQKEVKELIVSPEPYWKEQESMYIEGRRYFHELEDHCDSDAENNSTTKHDQSVTQHLVSSQINLDRNSANFINQSVKQNSVSQKAVQNNIRNNSRDLSTKSSMNSNISSTIPNKTLTENDLTVSRDSGSTKSDNWLGRWTNSIPLLPSWFKSESDWDQAAKLSLELDCKHFMRGVMDECTHLGNFSVPVDPELIIIVLAENDEYIPAKGYLKLSEIWPGSQVRTLPRGHISGFLFGKKEFRKAIADSFALHATKYFSTELRHSS